MIIGNVDFNLDEVAKLSYQEFKEKYRGKLSVDLDQTWRQLQAKSNSPESRKTKNARTTKKNSRKGTKAKRE